MKKMKLTTPLILAALLAAIVSVAGCGKKEESGTKAKAAATQVAAKVNKEEITVHQVNNVLARNRNIKPEAAFDAKREILNRLIDQALAKQAAIDTKLDRSPNIVQAIEAARNEILARAYLEKFAASQPKPTEEEVKKYYAEHPELFAQRRVFSIEEIVIEPNANLADQLREQVTNARSLQDIAAWLKSQDVKFATNRGIRAAEQIPLERLPRIQEMKDGTMQLFREGDGPFQILRIAASKAAPVDLATATPRIQQFLFNRRSAELVANELKRLRDKSEITYAGEFADDAAGTAARAKAEAEVKAKTAAAEKARAEAETRAREAELSKARAAAEAQARRDAEAKARETQSKSLQLRQETIDKGVKGLR